MNQKEDRMTEPVDDARGELLPCPFCGGEAAIDQLGTSTMSCVVVCTDCGCRHESGDTRRYERTKLEHPRRRSRNIRRRGVMDCTEWQPYFAWWPVTVDAYEESERKNGKLSYPKMGWVERRFCVWIDVDDEDRVEHRVWRFRLSQTSGDAGHK